MTNSASSLNGTSAGGTGKKLVGFAAMDPERQRQIASLGGKTAHQNGSAHEFTTETGRAAAMKVHRKTPKRASSTS